MASPISINVVQRAAEAAPRQPENFLSGFIHWMGANPSAVVAAFGVIVTVILFWLGGRRNRLEATFKTLEMLQAKDAREARFGLRELISPTAKHKGDFSKMKSEDRATVSSILLLFGFIGALGRRRRIELNIFFDAFASSVVINHERLRAYSKWRDNYRTYKDGTLWKDFDWLASKAKRYLAIQGEPNPIRRIAARLRIVKPSWTAVEALEASAHAPLPLVTKPKATRHRTPSA